MADDFELKLDSAGMEDMLRSDGIRRYLDDLAASGEKAAGRGMAHSSTIGRTRAMAMVWTETPEAMVAEARHGALTRAIDAMRR